MGVIYVRPNLINGKKYVGQATNLKKRQNDWKCLSQPYAGPAINAARAKYGIDAFDFEILKECDDKELDYWEKYYIKELNTKAPYGYNLTDGGEGMTGYTHSEETIKKISEIQKGKNNSFYGKHHSEEQKKKISEANKGKTPWNKGKTNIFSEETKKKMSDAQKGEKNNMYGKNHTDEAKKKMSDAKKGEKSYIYGKHLSEETKNKISKAKKGKHHSEEIKKKMSEAKKGIPNIKLSKPVLQIDMITNEIIAEFPSIREIERQFGFLHSNISKCCNGKQKSAYGFKWKYKESVA